MGYEKLTIVTSVSLNLYANKKNVTFLEKRYNEWGLGCCLDKTKKRVSEETLFSAQDETRTHTG